MEGPLLVSGPSPRIKGVFRSLQPVPVQPPLHDDSALGSRGAGRRRISTLIEATLGRYLDYGRIPAPVVQELDEALILRQRDQDTAVEVAGFGEGRGAGLARVAARERPCGERVEEQDHVTHERSARGCRLVGEEGSLADDGRLPQEV